MIHIIYPIFLGIWRRWFGGGLNFLPDNRFLQHVIGFLACSFVLWVLGYSPIQVIACGCVLQGLFWARSHGCCFDFGHGTVVVNRYEQLWYWKYIKKYIPENMLYGYACDFFLMNIRYTLPSIVISLILLNPAFVFAGMVVAGVYALMWACYDLGWTKDPTEHAEFLSGVLVGFLLTL
jgi:hypothetical protein